MMIEKTTAVVAISVAVLALAALGTVFLVFAAHAATIRRVNARPLILLKCYSADKRLFQTT
jgi:hypothetical protein